jgi:hypothetical protein
MKGFEMSVYFDIFSNWGDVQNNFDMSEPEPEVLFAAYEYENYSGEALVIFRRDGQLFTVHGSHCSCHGLEEQWVPEESSPEVVRCMVESSNGDWAWAWEDDLRVRHEDALLKVCDLLESKS